ncbi:DoxX-like family protein [Polaribacter sp. Z022]|uniref:DoxX-like family protein n=1 Tax=Polaribacter sp. Z022 TaxID=2927125 RepID=UPI002021608F|nr:DoxX-like family protein [Polaribacter sp. Z022]MCL7753790.1 DoxX-like family protein [Polaribacter sp. Z022]
MNLFKYLISSVWFVNGFYCKILNLVPRHQEIVERILGEQYSREFTFTIGVLEILMIVWILSGYKIRLNAKVQILIIITMNLIEFFRAKDLLLFGNLNLVFSIFFCALIYYKEFILKQRSYA